MNFYKCLINQVFTNNEYSIVPIRYEDRYDIMKWRNEQMYHLRQKVILTEEMQDAYFNNVIKSLYDQEEPSQIIFSFLKNDKCIGYGGLVHINWVDRNAEISFLIKTELDKEGFTELWTIFLSLIENVAFKSLKLHKLFVYAFDLRPHLYTTLQQNIFFKDAILKEHCFYNNKFIDVVIHSKINPF
jgi:RimJ/RimL family protein N-acetyltransferase